jgi:hypothetical protein
MHLVLFESSRSMRVGLIALIGVMLFAAIGVQRASAATLVVGSGTPASCTEAALDAQLAAAAPGDTIQFNCGGAPYTFALLSEKILTKDVTIDGGGLITFSAVGAHRLIRVNPGISVVLRGLTIRDGSATTGGGILNLGALGVQNSIISNNVASSNGGGISSVGGALAVQNTTITSNIAGSNGGGIYSTSPVTTVQNSTITNNSAQRGGGLSVIGGILTIQNSTVQNNTATQAGGGDGLYRDGGFTVVQTSQIQSTNPSNTSNTVQGDSINPATLPSGSTTTPTLAPLPTILPNLIFPSLPGLLPYPFLPPLPDIP